MCSNTITSIWYWTTYPSIFWWVINIQLTDGAECVIMIRPAFVNILFPVTRLYHTYSTALVIIIVIDDLKYVTTFVATYLVSSMENSRSFWKCYPGVQASKSLGTLVVHSFTTDVSIMWLTFQCTLSAKKNRSLQSDQKLRIRTVLHCLFKIMNY